MPEGDIVDPATGGDRWGIRGEKREEEGQTTLHRRVLGGGQKLADACPTRGLLPSPEGSSLLMATLALGCAPSPRTARIQNDPRPCLVAAGETEGGSKREKPGPRYLRNF